MLLRKKMKWKNKLYFGDNLGILREHVATESVGLIYLDLPFNSTAGYDVPVRAGLGVASARFPCPRFLRVCIRSKGLRQCDAAVASGQKRP